MSRVRQYVELRSVGELVAEIESGALALADFQRDFDWSDKDARSLLATLLMGWPAGSLLLMRGDTTLVSSRPFAHGPTTHARPTRMVLDGQQRLTAVFHALADVGPVVHAINVSALSADDVEELEDGMRTFTRDQWARHRHSPWYKGELYIPLYELRASGQFFPFRDVAETTQPVDSEQDITTLLQQAWRHRLSRLEKYQFPVVLIEPEAKTEVDDAAVSRIFERVNRSGQRLGAFDLVVARTYTPGSPYGNLRDLWEDARLEDSMMDRWLGPDGLAEDGMPLLQSIALTSPKADVRQSAVLDLEPSAIVSEWPRAVEAVGEALRFLAERCGVLRPEWLPYRAMLITLSAVAMDHDLSASRGVLEQWFWTRAFSLRFDAAANTRTAEEYYLLRAAIADGRLPAVEPIRVDALSRATRRRFQALYRAVLCLLAVRDPLDLSGEPLLRVRASTYGSEPDIVVASAMRRQIGSDYHLRAATSVLASRQTAGELRREGLEALAVSPSEALATQLLPTVQLADPAQWVNERVRLICDELLQRAGQPLPDPGTQPDFPV